MPDNVYPAIKIAGTSRAVPLKNHVQLDEAEDSTFYERRFGIPEYQLIVEHSWILQADFDLIIAAFDAGGWQLVPIQGRDYRGLFDEEPYITKRSGPNVQVRSLLKGNRYGW